MKVKEALFQKACVRELRIKYHYLVPVAIQNETNTKSRYALVRHWQDMGKLWGCADMMLFDLRKKTIYFIEFKAYNILKRGGYSPAGKQTENQKKFQELVENIDYEYWLIDTPIKWEEFIKEKTSLQNSRKQRGEE